MASFKHFVKVIMSRSEILISSFFLLTSISINNLDSFGAISFKNPLPTGPLTLISRISPSFVILSTFQYREQSWKVHPVLSTDPPIMCPWSIWVKRPLANLSLGSFFLGRFSFHFLGADRPYVGVGMVAEVVALDR